MAKDSKRLFIAINIPDELKSELFSIHTILPNPQVRWTPQENLHITLHFIGETSIEEILTIEEKIVSISSKCSSFKMTLEKLKVIRKNRNPSMVWVQLQENETFTQLAKEFQITLPGDSSKAPIPHITLARIKRGKKVALPVLPEIKQTVVEVTSIELMESTTGNQAPVYKIMKRFELRK